MTTTQTSFNLKEASNLTKKQSVNFYLIDLEVEIMRFQGYFHLGPPRSRHGDMILLT